MSKYKVYICGDAPCPNDADFEHRFYFGCVPKDFSDRTGRSKTHSQTKRADNLYHWDGGCDRGLVPSDGQSETAVADTGDQGTTQPVGPD